MKGRDKLKYIMAAARQTLERLAALKGNGMKTGIVSKEKGTFQRRRYYACYTIIFAFCALTAFLPYLTAGKTLIRMGDGHWQHVKALGFYSNWLKSFFQAFFSGKWKNLPLWTFSAGYGANVIGTMHYYVIGDPFAFLSVFFPLKGIAFLYQALIFLRLYAAGICFSELCFYTRKRESGKILAGTVIYLFTAYTAENAVRHPFFLNSMIWFPLLILGIEKAIREKRYRLYITAVFLTAVSNAVFFYMTVVLIVVYAIWRAVTEYGKRLRSVFRLLLKLLIAAIPGTCLGAVTLVPFAEALLGSQRSGNGLSFPAHVTLSQVIWTAAKLLSDTGAGGIGFSGIALASILIVLLVSSSGRKWKSLIVLCAVCGVSHYFRFIVSGFSYLNTRWVWALCLAGAYLFVVSWDDIDDLKIRHYICLISVFLIYLLVSRRFAYPSVRWSTRLEALSGIGFVCLLLWRKYRPGLLQKKKTAVLWRGAVLLSACISSAALCYFRAAPQWGNYVSEFTKAASYTADYSPEMLEKVSKGEEWSLLRSEAYPVSRYIGAEEAFRYSGHSLSTNSNVLMGTANNQFYWSLANSNLDLWMKELSLPNGRDYMYSGAEERSMLLGLTGIRYFFAEAPVYVPYGFEPLTDKDNPMQTRYPYYRNCLGLSVGTMFYSHIPERDYQKMDSVERQQALLQGVVIKDDETCEGIPEADVTFSDENLKFTIQPGDGVQMDENGLYTVTEDNAILHITFQGKEGGETYLYIRGLDRKDQANECRFDVTGYFDGGSSGSQSFYYYPEKYKWTDHKHDYLIQTGFGNGLPMTGFDLTFPKKGVYVIDQLEVVFQPLGDAEKQLSCLQKSVMEDIDFHADGRTFSTSEITGNISAEKDGVLFLSIPYEKGWTAFVDGEKTKILQADTGFCGIRLTEGEHEIVLRYFTPGLKTGLILAGLGILMLLIYSAVRVPRRAAQ